MQPCKICLRPYGNPFLWVSDALWDKIGMGKREFLCAHCLIDKLSEIGLAFYVTDGKEGQHLITPAAMNINVRVNEPLMKAAREEFYAS